MQVKFGRLKNRQQKQKRDDAWQCPWQHPPHPASKT